MLWFFCCCQELHHLACCLWPVKDKPVEALCLREKKDTAAKQHKRCPSSNFALWLPHQSWLWIACSRFTSIHKLLRKGFPLLNGGEVEKGGGGGGLKIVHFGDEQPQRGASSALGDRYLATGSHVAKSRSCLLSFISPSHSNTLPSLLYTSAHLLLSHVLPPSFFEWLVKGWTLNRVLQSVRKVTVFDVLFIDVSLHIFPSPLFLSILPSFSFYRESGWSLGDKLTGASSDLPLKHFLLSSRFRTGVTKATPFNKNSDRYRLWTPFLGWFMNADSCIRVLLYP